MNEASSKASAQALKTRVLEDKAAYRRHLTRLPVAEKLRILEEMRDTTRALRKVREQNKANVQAAVSARVVNGHNS